MGDGSRIAEAFPAISSLLRWTNEIAQTLGVARTGFGRL